MVLYNARGHKLRVHALIKSAICDRDGYISLEQAKDLVEKCEEIGRMLGGMMNKADSFCNPQSPSVKEEQAAYLTGSQ
jgi:hypothetical protein